MATVTLRNGDVIDKGLGGTIYLNLVDLKEKNYVALWDLAMKCKNSSHRITPTLFDDSKTTLLEYKLLNEDETVPEDVKKIVINSVLNIDLVDVDMFSLNLQNPRAPTQEKPLSINNWSWCSIL